MLFPQYRELKAEYAALQTKHADTIKLLHEAEYSAKDANALLAETQSIAAERLKLAQVLRENLTDLSKTIDVEIGTYDEAGRQKLFKATDFFINMKPSGSR